MGILNYLLPTFFFVFSFGEILRIRLFSSVSSGILDILLILIILVWFVFTKKKNKYILKKPIIIFVLMAAFSLFMNVAKFKTDELLISSLYLFRFILYSGIYFVFVDIGENYKEKILKYMFFSGVLIMTFGYLQYFLYPNINDLYNLGWDKHFYRLFSTFLDPNFAGTFLVLFFVFTFLLRDKIFTKKWYFVSNIILISNFIAIILTYSRGAILMFFACVIIYSLLIRSWRLIGGFIIISIVIFLILSPRFDVENTNLLRVTSAKARIDSNKLALMIWEKNPMGVGFNTYRYAREQYGDIDTSKFGPSHSGAGVENSFTLVLVTTGILGLAVYIYLLYKMIKLGFSEIKKNKIALVLIVSLGGLIVNGLFINSLLYSFNMLWIWMLLGLTESKKHE